MRPDFAIIAIKVFSRVSLLIWCVQANRKHNIIEPRAHTSTTVTTPQELLYYPSSILTSLTRPSY